MPGRFCGWVFIKKIEMSVTILREKIADKHDHIKNVYAQDKEGNMVFVLDAISGRMGYFCPGCGIEQEAVKQTKRKKDGGIRKSYFRHRLKKSKGNKKCVYSDETYRHKVAKEIIQRLMRIKVPSLYVTNPNNPRESAKLKDSWFIDADRIMIERNVYRDDEGTIRLGNGYGYINPDVIFLSKNGYPILFVELVATHEVDAEKLSKIKHIGIDTISVRIPKESPEDIERVFSTVSNTIWIYNNERENTNYWNLLKSYDCPIQRIDGFEKQVAIYGKSFSCREAEIKLFIGRLREYLDRGQHRERIQRIREEKERISEHIKMVQDSITREVEEPIRRTKKDLERRYRRKVDELNRKRRNLISDEAELYLLQEIINTFIDRIHKMDSHWKSKIQAEMEGLYREQAEGIRREARRIDEIIREINFGKQMNLIK